MTTLPLLLAASLMLQGAEKPFACDAGNFRIMMPGVPRERTFKAPSPVGPIETHIYLAEQDGASWAAAYIDHPDQGANTDPDKVLERTVANAVEKTKGTLVSKEDIRIDGFPGMEIVMTVPPRVQGGPPTTHRSRFYLVRTRFYHVTLSGRADQVRTKAGDAFFESFALIEKPASAESLMIQGAEKPFACDAGNFKIAMPGVPTEQTIKAPSAIGPLEIHIYMVNQDGTAWGTVYVDYPEKLADVDPDEVLEGAVADAVGNLRGALVLSKKDIQLDGFPGKEFEATVPAQGGGNLTYRGRIYLVKTRLHQLTVIGPADRVKTKAGDAYLASFALIKKPTP